MVAYGYKYTKVNSIHKNNQYTIHQWTTNTQGNSDYSPLQYGSNIPPIHQSETIRIIFQNPQFSMQLGKYQHEFYNTIEKLQTLNASIFAISSPNINWYNQTNTSSFQFPFQQAYHHAHLSPTSSIIGKQGMYRNYTVLPGGNAIVTLDHWA